MFFILHSNRGDMPDYTLTYRGGRALAHGDTDRAIKVLLRLLRGGHKVYGILKKAPDAPTHLERLRICGPEHKTKSGLTFDTQDSLSTKRALRIRDAS